MTTTRESALSTLLEQVLDGEPPLEDAVEAVFHRAELLRRRRLRLLIAAGIVAVLVVAAIGYGVASFLVPPAEPRRPAPATPPAPVDPALLAVRSAVDPSLRVVPREPFRGEGWRQFTVLSRDSGRPRGLVEISVYAAPGGLCFPVRADPGACARPDHAGDDVEYARYADDRDEDWQVHQAIARRLSDGRVVAVLATGERGTGNVVSGRPPLSPLRTATLAADPRLMSAFGPAEKCNGPDPACPLLMVPVPVEP